MLHYIELIFTVQNFFPSIATITCIWGKETPFSYQNDTQKIIQENIGTI